MIGPLTRLPLSRMAVCDLRLKPLLFFQFSPRGEYVSFFGDLDYLTVPPSAFLGRPIRDVLSSIGELFHRTIADVVSFDTRRQINYTLTIRHRALAFTAVLWRGGPSLVNCCVYARTP